MARHHRGGCRLLLAGAALLLLVVAPTTGQTASEPAGPGTDDPPLLLNAEDVDRLVDQHYPPLLRMRRVEGVVKLLVRIDEQGRIDTTRIQETSGYAELDEAGEAVARLMRFQPARRGGVPAAVWAPVHIGFGLPRAEPARDSSVPEPRVPEPSVPEAVDRAAARSDTTPDRAAEPTDAGDAMDVPPRLENSSRVSRELARLYPARLRDLGIGGAAKVRFSIDSTGRVLKAEIHRSSGYHDLDEAALRVSRIMRFTPALKEGRAVPACVVLDVVFETRR
ncbi:MAG: TonB family protein [Gemmatimonadota bacterium]